MNWDKSECILNHAHQEIAKMKANFEDMLKNVIKYLGINISRNIQDMIKWNFDNMRKQIKQKIKEFQKLSISWFERIAICEIKILSKIIFLFWMLPINLLKSSYGKCRADND